MAVPHHVNARCPVYPLSTVRRRPVADEHVDWDTALLDYTPPWYSRAESSAAPEAASIGNGLLLNPRGRTGLGGQGRLRCLGPNHAVDPLVSRWQRHEDGTVVMRKGEPVLEVVLIRRRGTGEWALPGGMVEVGEHAVQTMQREFTEEALNGQPMPDAAERLFHASSTVLYTGYVDDPRNTDHAWIETVCINVHDGTGKALGQLALQAGSDASAVAWVDASKVGLLYADHAAYVQEALALQRGLFVPRSQPMAVPIASLRNARHVR